MARTTSAASSSATNDSGRLGADDWLRAAFEIMVDDGIGGVKIQRLCERLGVTKGSFYWHFEDIDSFLGALADRWADESAHLPGLDDDGADPEQVLLRAMKLFADGHNRNLTRAMRDWAQTDERARAAIRLADRAVFAAVQSALVRLGFEAGEAELRAKILYYAGVGFAHVGPLGSRSSAQQQLTATWELLARV